MEQLLQAWVCTPHTDYPFTIQVSRVSSILEFLALGWRKLSHHLVLTLSGAEQYLLGIQPPPQEMYFLNTGLSQDRKPFWSSLLGGEQMDSVNTQYLGPCLTRTGYRGIWQVQTLSLLSWNWLVGKTEMHQATKVKCCLSKRVCMGWSEKAFPRKWHLNRQREYFSHSPLHPRPSIELAHDRYSVNVCWMNEGGNEQMSTCFLRVFGS